MKYRILAVIVIFIMLFSITVSAQGYEYTVSPSKDFVSAKYGDDLSELSQKLNTTPEQLNSYFDKNGIIYLAVSDNGKSQIKISTSSDDFSSEVADISQLDDDSLTKFAKTIDSDATILTNNDRKFIYTKNVYDNNVGGVYTVTQYITICDNQTFYFTGYNDGKDTSAQITSAFESFNLSVPQSNFTLWTALIIVGVVIFSAVAIVMIIGIVKAHFKSKKEAIENEN